MSDFFVDIERRQATKLDKLMFGRFKWTLREGHLNDAFKVDEYPIKTNGGAFTVGSARRQARAAKRRVLKEREGSSRFLPREQV